MMLEGSYIYVLYEGIRIVGGMKYKLDFSYHV